MRPKYSYVHEKSGLLNQFAPRNLDEKRILKLVEQFSGHCQAINS